jgi:hypothetical protein
MYCIIRPAFLRTDGRKIQELFSINSLADDRKVIRYHPGFARGVSVLSEWQNLNWIMESKRRLRIRHINSITHIFISFLNLWVKNATRTYGAKSNLQKWKKKKKRSEGRRWNESGGRGVVEVQKRERVGCCLKQKVEFYDSPSSFTKTTTERDNSAWRHRFSCLSRPCLSCYVACCWVSVYFNVLNCSHKQRGLA